MTSTRSTRAVCTACRKHPAEEGYRRCRDCRLRIQANNRKRVAARRKQGLCRCGAVTVSAQHTHCRKCLRRLNAQHKLRVKRWRLAGRCPRCGRQPSDGNVQCDWHLALGRAYWDRMPSAQKQRYLAQQAKLAEQRGAPHQKLCKARWRANGRCVTCGAQAPIHPLTGKHYAKCVKHLLLDNKRARRKRALSAEK